MKWKLFLNLQKMGNNQSSKESPTFICRTSQEPKLNIQIPKQPEPEGTGPIVEPFPYCDHNFLIQISANSLQPITQFNLVDRDSAVPQLTFAESKLQNKTKFSSIANTEDVECFQAEENKETEENQERFLRIRRSRRSKKLSKYRIEDCEFSETTETYLGL